MPISSGATGRVDVGVDTAIAWTPDGLKKETKPYSRNYDSYLKRYLESTQKRKQESDCTGDTIVPPDDKVDASKRKSRDSDDGDNAEKVSSKDSSKKSTTCTIL